MLNGAHDTVALTDTAIARAIVLNAMGFRTYDALHLACAEPATAGVFLTTDDRVHRMATRHTAPRRVRGANPLDGRLAVMSPCIRRP